MSIGRGFKVAKKAFFLPAKGRKRQQESVNQKTYVKALNALGIGFFYRVKNMGTFDKERGFYRKPWDTTVAIPDICGYLKNGRAVYIEVKYVPKYEKKKKLVFKTQIGDNQKRFLYEAYKAGCIASVAFCLDDVLATVKDGTQDYIRHPRTYMFLQGLDDVLLEKIVEEYKAKISARRKLYDSDPLARLPRSTDPD